MRAWGLVDTLTIACLLLVIPWCTQCDKGEGKNIEKSDSHEPKTAAKHAGQVNNVTSAGKINISMSLDVSNATVNASKPPELHASSREGVLTKQSTLSLPKVESSSGKPFTPRPVAQETPKVLSSADAQKTHDKTIEDSHKEAAKNWMEGGGSLPVPRSKESESSEHKNSNPQVAGEKIEHTSTAPHQKVAARKGAILPNDNSSEPHPAHAELLHPHSGPSTVATTSTTRPRKHKPLFTMVQGDKFTSGSESILESPTTGRDYVFPLVLLIFAVPGTVFLIRFLYKRGTEFTERQQYHRMYLIDDEFRTPFFERWKRAIGRFISGENCQTANLTNIGDKGVHPRTNYNSF